MTLSTKSKNLQKLKEQMHKFVRSIDGMVPHKQDHDDGLAAAYTVIHDGVESSHEVCLAISPYQQKLLRDQKREQSVITHTEISTEEDKPVRQDETITYETTQVPIHRGESLSDEFQIDPDQFEIHLDEDNCLAGSNQYFSGGRGGDLFPPIDVAQFDRANSRFISLSPSGSGDLV